MIDISLVETLINQQFPQYKNLTIKKVKTQGHDNTTFHLGQNFIASFPNAASYGETIENQYRLLGKIQSYISIELSQTIEIGKASRLFPYPWSIKTYIKGKSSNLILESIDREKFAVSIGTVLHQFKSIHFSQEEINLLIPSKKNWFRGANLSVYKKDIDLCLDTIKTGLSKSEKEIIEEICSKAINSKNHFHSFVHGDIAQGNLIINNNELTGIIDFNTMACGDPACDLMMAWNTFDNKSRELFKKKIEYDNETWMRGMGWTLWKALLEFSSISQSQARDWQDPKKVIDAVINDYNIAHT